jgi:Tfp pilus assembly protein PilP
MMRHVTRVLLVLGLGLIAAAACDDKRPAAKVEPKKAPPPVPPPPGPPPAPEAPTPTKAALELSDKDFTEGSSNRDPFRSFLSAFAKPTRRLAAKQQRKVILPRYGLDELKLIAVVTGGIRPCAMFRDPTGLGVTVKRGDFISKNAGKVKQILSDKVVVEIEEQSEDKSSLVDRVIDLHPKEEREAAEGERE